MSFKVEITGHSPSDHADQVRDIAVRATRELLALGGSATLTGYAADSKLTRNLSNVDVEEAVNLEAAANAPAEEDTTDDGVNATDAAVGKAKELKVDLSTVKGTGVNGRITVGDVEAAAQP